MLINVSDDEQATVTAAGEIQRIGSAWTLAGRRLEDRAGGGFDVDRWKGRAGEGGD